MIKTYFFSKQLIWNFKKYMDTFFRPLRSELDNKFVFYPNRGIKTTAPVNVPYECFCYRSNLLTQNTTFQTILLGFTRFYYQMIISLRFVLQTIVAWPIKNLFLPVLEYAAQLTGCAHQLISLSFYSPCFKKWKNRGRGGGGKKLKVLHKKL